MADDNTYGISKQAREYAYENMQRHGYNSFEIQVNGNISFNSSKFNAESTYGQPFYDVRDSDVRLYGHVELFQSKTGVYEGYTRLTAIHISDVFVQATLQHGPKDYEDIDFMAYDAFTVISTRNVGRWTDGEVNPLEIYLKYDLDSSKWFVKGYQNAEQVWIPLDEIEDMDLDWDSPFRSDY